uniref:Uncharacterized protein n=1 Tax=Sinocyclocheilus grahami TaxID=75366 RepID=A0A672MA32_SINGR
MEGKLDMDVSPSHHQHQRGSWKSFHGRPKLTGSPKLGKKDKKQESGFWIFKKKRPNGLDRAVSSSQPNLHSAPAASDGGESGRTRCGMPEQSVGTAAAAAASLGAEIQMLKRTISSKPTLSELVQSQHKPALQGSTCVFCNLVSDLLWVKLDQGASSQSLTSQMNSMVQLDTM